MTKIAVVTGCAGFIGAQLTRYLLINKWKVYGIDKLTRVANKDYIDEIKNLGNFQFIKKDIKNLKQLPDCDIIFNLAAESDVDNSSNDTASFIDSNISGVQNLLSLIDCKIKIKEDKPIFFQVSTDEVYGAISTGSHHEDSILNPGNPYAITKATADMLVINWGKTSGNNYYIARPSNNYGRFQYPEKLIPLAIKNLDRNKQIKLHNMGEPVRTWTHVEDTIRGFLTIIEHGTYNSIYNISSEFEQKNIDTVKQILKNYFGTEVDTDKYIDLSFNRPGQDMRYSISCEPIKKLGWKASKVFSDEIRYIIKSSKGNFIW